MKKPTSSLKLLARRRRGMTLIEIIVVITILSVLMAAVGVAVIPRLEEAKRSTAKTDIENILGMCRMYYLKKGKYPDTGAGLKVLVDEQYSEKPLIDPWGNPYVYMVESGKPVVLSYGKDGAPGGNDADADISSKDSPDAAKK